MNEQNNAPRSPYAEAIASLYNQLKNANPEGNADLTNIPMRMAMDGHTPITPITSYGGSATVGNTPNYGSFVPNQVDANGNIMHTLSDKELNAYATAVLNGTPDYRRLQVGPINQGIPVGQSPNGTPVMANMDTEPLYDLMNTYNALKGMANR